MIAVALELAVKQQRVLKEIPVNRSWQHNTGKARARQAAGFGNSSRWCDRPPYTFECFYNPWTHCLAPTAEEITTAAVPTTAKSFRALHEPSLLKVKLSWVQDTSALWMRAQRPMSDAAMRLLFQPRPWVVSLSKCIMQQQGLQQHEFFTVHFRQSVEKDAEARGRNLDLPDMRSHIEMTVALAERLGQRHMFLQTASPSALSNFSRLAQRAKLRLSYTDNPRSEHDTWGGWRQDSPMLTTTVAAVNTYIGSHASTVVSATASAWTRWQLAQMPTKSLAFSYCCDCRGNVCIPRFRATFAHVHVHAHVYPWQGNFKVFLPMNEWEHYKNHVFNMTVDHNRRFLEYGKPLSKHSKCRFGFRYWNPKRAGENLRLILHSALPET